MVKQKDRFKAEKAELKEDKAKFKKKKDHLQEILPMVL